MQSRVKGTATSTPYLYNGLTIMPRSEFIKWASDNVSFLRLYKRWVVNDLDRKLTPSPNRINSKKGYTISNVEWVTSSQNSALASVVKVNNQILKTQVYKILGVNK